MSWEEIYSRGQQLNRWPWTDLVSLVKRNGGAHGKNVLELGCGASLPNARFFVEEGAKSYTGVDRAFGEQIYRYTEQDTSMCTVGVDFTRTILGGPYDLVVDRAAVTHNTTEGIESCLSMVREQMSEKGVYIGVDWFSITHQQCGSGIKIDEYTEEDCGGQFEGCGMVHFSDAPHLLRLFKDFEIIWLEQKVRLPKDGDQFGSWDIVGRV